MKSSLFNPNDFLVDGRFSVTELLTAIIKCDETFNPFDFEIRKSFTDAELYYIQWKPKMSLTLSNLDSASST